MSRIVDVFNFIYLCLIIEYFVMSLMSELLIRDGSVDLMYFVDLLFVSCLLCVVFGIVGVVFEFFVVQWLGLEFFSDSAPNML